MNNPLVLSSENLPVIVLKALPEEYSLINFSTDAPLPVWANQEAGEALISITRSAYGLSVICPSAWPPDEMGASVQQVSGWRVLRVEAPRDWTMHGLYSRLTQPLADDAISIYIVGSYNADHILVRLQDFARAVQILSRFCQIV